MSTRLQVILSVEELEELRALAVAQRMTLSEWVRQALRDARQRAPRRSAGRKLDALRVAMAHDAPTPDIDQMNAEIARGYLVGEPEE